MKAIKVYGLFLLIMAMMPGQVFAHATWDELPASPTKPRLNQNIKVGSCGGVQRGNTPLVSTPNAIINVQFKETVPHPGFFTIYFSESNDQNFKFPKQIPHNVQNNFTYKETYTMPYELCNDCTLQLIQTMLNDPNNPTFYYSCTDITLKSPDINVRITQPLVTNPVITSGNGSVTLSWVNPKISKNPTFYKVLIVGNAANTAPNTDPLVDLDTKLFKVGDKINANKNNDVVVYNGKLNTAVISSLMNDNQYTYQIFAYDINLNYSKAATLSAIPSTANVAPSVALAITQGIFTSTNVTPNGGNIVIKANVTDGNVNDKHTFNWVSNNFNFTDGDNIDNTFTIKANEIAPLPIDSTYNIAVTATDTGGLKGISSVVLTLKANPPPIAIDNGVINNITDNGGCTVSKSAKFDPLLMILSLLSLVIVGFKSRKST